MLLGLASLTARQTWLTTVGMICACSNLAWRRQDGTLWIDRHGVYLWMRLRPRDTLQRERERERERERGGGQTEEVEEAVTSAILAFRFS